MIHVDSNYKNYIENNTSFTIRNKLVVDGKEYLGDVLKTFPKISHSATKICGSFPIKTVSFEIFDYDRNIDFLNKEIEVYKGLVIDGNITYVKQGIFIARENNITNNISDRSIKFEKVEDRTQLLENRYESNLDWNNNAKHTGLEIVQEICTKRGIVLKNTNFAFSNYQFKQPNFPETITDRQVIARLAEIGGENVIFDANGLLEIKSQYNTNDTIQRIRYEKISKENLIEYNSVVLGKEGITDDVKYPETIVDERVSLEILDNPYVDLYREEIIEEVARHIIGLKYIPFEVVGFIDGFIYEINDVVNFIDRNNEVLNAVIINIDNTSRMKSITSLNFSDVSKSDYILAGSNKEGLNKVKLEVNHINKTIESLITEIKEIEESVEVLNPQVDASILLISTNNNNIPYSTKSYTIGYTCKYLNEPIELIPQIMNTYSGITTSVDKDKITISVTNTTALQNDDNKIELKWTYKDDYSEVSASRIIVVSALKSETEQNVIISDVQPVDNNFIWFDTINNEFKKYIDGDWKSVNDNSDDINTLKEQINDTNDLLNGTTNYVETEDEEFKEDKKYYVQNEENEYIEYTGPTTGNPKQLGLYEKHEIIGLSQKYQDLKTDIDSKVNSGDLSNAIKKETNNIINTSTYTKQQIQQIINGTGVDGVKVTAVVSTEATFDKDGMHYDKTGAKTSSTINQYGMTINYKDDNNEKKEEVLFSGYVNDDRYGENYKNDTLVYTHNLLSTGYTEVGHYGRFEEYPGPHDEHGVGFYIL